MVDLRISYVCSRAAQIRKGTEISQHDAFVQANAEWVDKHQAFVQSCPKNVVKVTDTYYVVDDGQTRTVFRRDLPVGG